MMQRYSAVCCILAVLLLFPATGQAFDEIDQIGSNNFKPMKGCPNCHLREQSSSGQLKLIGATLSNADLKQVDLRGADLRGANLRESDLRQADLRDANISGADLRNADLSGADLRGANLFNANLTGAKLHGKLGPAKLCNTTMPDKSVNNSNCDGGNKDDPPRLVSEKVENSRYRRSFNFLGYETKLP